MKLRLAHGDPVEPEVVGDRVHRPLHREDALRPAGAAVRRDDDGRRVEAVELDAVGPRLVRPEQLRRGDDRDDDAVRQVGAVVVPEPHVEPEQPPVVVEPDADVLQLRPLVRRRDEVLAAVLGPLHLGAEPSRRPRHEHLLRPRVHDLHAETAAHVGRDARRRRSAAARAWPRRRRARRSSSASSSTAAAATRRPPTGRTRRAPRAACTRCARPRGRARARAAPPRSRRARRRPPAPGGRRRCPGRPGARGAAPSRAAADADDRAAATS